MGCANSREHYHFEVPSFEGDQWLQRHRYRLFWKALDPKISQSEVTMLKDVWSSCSAGYGTHIIQTLFFTIFERCPEIRDDVFGWQGVANGQLLRNKRFLRHCLLFQDTIGMVIDELGKPDLGSKIVTFGSQHAFFTKRHFSEHYWTVFGQAMMDLNQQIALPRAYRYKANKFVQAWRKLILFIISSMQIGYAVGQHQNDLPARRAFKRAVVDNELMFLLSHSTSHLEDSPTKLSFRIGDSSRETSNCRPSVVSFSIDEASPVHKTSDKSLCSTSLSVDESSSGQRHSFRHHGSQSMEETSTRRRYDYFLTVQH